MNTWVRSIALHALLAVAGVAIGLGGLFGSVSATATETETAGVTETPDVTEPPVVTETTTAEPSATTTATSTETATATTTSTATPPDVEAIVQEVIAILIRIIEEILAATPTP
jgi:cytoskeletal protein RodZ